MPRVTQRRAAPHGHRGSRSRRGRSRHRRQHVGQTAPGQARTIRGRTVTTDGAVIANVRVAGELRIRAKQRADLQRYVESQGPYGS